VPSLKAIRTRIVSVKSTQKITRAMKMVAGARLNRAQQRIVAMRPYALKTGEILQSVAATIPAEGGGIAGPSVPAAGAPEATPTDVVRPDPQSGPPHPLLAKRPEASVLFIVLSADRGLCGAFNTNVNKATEREWRDKEAKGAKVSFLTLGRKGREYLTRRGGTIAKDFPKVYEGLDLSKGRIVAAWMVGHFLKNDFDSVYLVYNEFKSAMTQKTSVERLLPLPEPAKPASSNSDSAALPNELLFEPNKHALLERLVPMYVEISIYRAMLESQAGFFGAQMTAMDAATRNAKEMIGRLTLAYNRARQAAITKELMEIIGGAEALKE
jgi:F-type H+-transporting ATPase subunit gamma